MLELCNISHSYTYGFFKKQEKIVLDSINLKIDKNECIALIGPSGCGKSTLAKIIAQIQKPTSGKVLFNNSPVCLDTLEKKRVFYKQVQILFQDLRNSLNPRYTIFENFQEPLCYLLNIWDSKTQYQKILPIFKALKLHEDILSYYPNMISGGQAQRVCLARMLLIQPQFIILDESTSGLDHELKEEVWNLFLSLQKETSCSFLFITHDIVLARKFCHTIMLMQNGKIVETISSKETFQSELGQEFMQCCNNFF